MSDRIYLSPPHMGGREIELIKDAFASNWIAPLGPHVEAFERECARQADVRAALALSSGTAAVLLAAKLLGVERGDTFVCSSLTFIASLAPLVQAGASPIFVDSEPESWNISPTALERALADAKRRGEMPKAVIAVDLYGQVCDMDRVEEICRAFRVPLIEDAAEAVGATYKGRPAGSFGSFSFYSFNGNKIITTSGGGMLLSNDEDAIARARYLSTQARDPAPWYQHTTTGYNFRMSNILAAVGRAQLELLEDRVAKRRAIFEKYREALSDIPGLTFMPEPEWSGHNRWLTTAIIDESCKAGPLDVIDALSKQNIESRPVWKPMHKQPVFDGARYFSHDGDVSARLFERGICLPSGSSMSERDQQRVIDVVRDVLA